MGCGVAWRFLALYFRHFFDLVENLGRGSVFTIAFPRDLHRQQDVASMFGSHVVAVVASLIIILRWDWAVLTDWVLSMAGVSRHGGVYD